MQNMMRVCGSRSVRSWCFGGGAVEFALVASGVKVVGHDLSASVVNLWTQLTTNNTAVVNSFHGILRQMDSLSASKKKKSKMGAKRARRMATA